MCSNNFQLVLHHPDAETDDFSASGIPPIEGMKLLTVNDGFPASVVPSASRGIVEKQHRPSALGVPSVPSSASCRANLSVGLVRNSLPATQTSDEYSTEFNFEAESSTAEDVDQFVVRFRPSLDILLLKEVKEINPFLGDKKEIQEKWNELTLNLQKLPELRYVNVRQCRERVTLLIVQFKTEDKRNSQKSGSDEEFTEIIILLTEVSSLQEDSLKLNQEATMKRKNDIQERRAGLLMRNAAVRSLAQKRNFHRNVTDTADIDDPPPVPAKKTKFSIDEYMVQKQELDAKSKEQDVQLKNEEIKVKQDEVRVKQEANTIERERLQIEAEEKRAQRELDRERFDLERQERLANMQNQNVTLRLLNAMLEKFK